MKNLFEMCAEFLPQKDLQLSLRSSSLLRSHKKRIGGRVGWTEHDGCFRRGLRPPLSVPMSHASNVRSQVSPQQYCYCGSPRPSAAPRLG